MLKIAYPIRTYKKPMKTLKPLLLTLALSTTVLITQAAEQTITQQKQVAGYHHQQFDNTQITTLLDLSIFNVSKN